MNKPHHLFPRVQHQNKGTGKVHKNIHHQAWMGQCWWLQIRLPRQELNDIILKSLWKLLAKITGAQVKGGPGGNCPSTFWQDRRHRPWRHCAALLLALLLAPPHTFRKPEIVLSFGVKAICWLEFLHSFLPCIVSSASEESIWFFSTYLRVKGMRQLFESFTDSKRNSFRRN
jgi:hypothetical protein